jgi:hypothetical protein
MKYGFTFGFLGGPKNAPPSLKGDYIWYTYNPKTGYQNNNGVREVKNDDSVFGAHPATRTTRSNTNYHGTMFSGNLIVLSGDGKINIPLNYDSTNDIVKGSVGWFNHTTKQMDQISALPLSTHHELKDGEYSLIYKLHTNQFSQDDLDLFTDEPEALLDWYWGKITIPSGIVKEAEDKIYTCTEGSGDILLELNYSESAELGQGNYWYSSPESCATKNIISNTEAEVENLCEQGADSWPRMGSNGIVEIDKLYLQVFRAQCLEGASGVDIGIGTISGKSRPKRTIRVNGFYQNKLIEIAKYTNNVPTYLFDGKTTTQWKVHTYLSCREILSDYLTIEGDYSWDRNIDSGIQTLRLIMNDAGVPTKVIDKNRVRFDGDNRKISTGVSIDVTSNGFTVMMAFSLPENTSEQYIVYSGNGPNVFQLKHEEGAPPEEIMVSIGKYEHKMTLNNNSGIQAICARYDHLTQRLELGMNGSDLTDVGQIVFDGQTGEVVLGTNGSSPYTGYLGEGVLTGAKEDDDFWKWFWNRVKNTPIT